jgi:hypothetical protein
MHLASDYIHPTPRGGRYRVRLYLPEDKRDAPVVICSEPPNNEDSSVTYSAHQIAAEVIRYHSSACRPCGSSTIPRRSQTASQRRSSWLFSRATKTRRGRRTWGRGGSP